MGNSYVPSKYRILIASVILILLVSIGYGVYRYMKPKEDVGITVNVIDANNEEGQQSKAKLEENKKDLGIDLEKIKEEARVMFNRRTAGRDVSKDTLKLYTTNYIIKYLYESPKAQEYYKQKENTSDQNVIEKTISDDVADYVNKEFDK